MCIVYYTVHNPCHCIEVHRDPEYCDEYLARYINTQEVANAAAAAENETLRAEVGEEAAVAAGKKAAEKKVAEEKAAEWKDKTDEGSEAQASTDVLTSASSTSEESIAFPPTFDTKVITFHPQLHGLRLRWEGYLFQSHNLEMVIRPDGFECPNMVTRFEDAAWVPHREVNENRINDNSSDVESDGSMATSSSSTAMSTIDSDSDTHTLIGQPIYRPAEKLYCPLCIVHEDIVRNMVEAVTGMDESAARLAELREKERKKEAVVKRREEIQRVINESQKRWVLQMRQQRRQWEMLQSERRYQSWLADQDRVGDLVRRGAVVEIVVPRSWRECENLKLNRKGKEWSNLYVYVCESPYADPEQALRANIQKKYEHGEKGIMGSYQHDNGHKVLLVLCEAWDAATKPPAEKDVTEDVTWYKGPAQIHEARLNAGVAMANATAAAQGPRQPAVEQEHWDKAGVYCGDYCVICKNRRAWGK